MHVNIAFAIFIDSYCVLNTIRQRLPVLDFMITSPMATRIIVRIESMVLDHTSENVRRPALMMRLDHLPHRRFLNIMIKTITLVRNKY